MFLYFARRDTTDIRVDPEDIFSFPENNIVLNRTEGAAGDMDPGLGRGSFLFMYLSIFSLPDNNIVLRQPIWQYVVFTPSLLYSSFSDALFTKFLLLSLP